MRYSPGDVTTLFYHQYWYWSRISRSPWLVKWGSGSPIAAIASTIDYTASSAVRGRTWHPLGERSPVQYCLAKVLRIGNRSRYETNTRLRSMYQQNLDHFVQCPLMAADWLEEIPLENFFFCSSEAISKENLLGGVNNLHGSFSGCKASMWAIKVAYVKPHEQDGWL